MGRRSAFLSINRKEAGYRSVVDRIADFGEVEQTLNSEDRMLQASRCMECGVPFCHWACPLGNLIPEWQDLLSKGKWEEAYRLIISKNNFPEFTGRVCPALCEKSCVLNLEQQPLTVRENEAAVAEYAFLEGYVRADPPRKRTGRKIAVIGSGLAGLATADMLNRQGHSVTVYEKDEYIGGLLRLGIPDFKLNKGIIERRLDLLKAEGIIFQTNTEIGKDISEEQLMTDFDAVCLAIGAGVPRDLPIEGREANGIYFALDFLKQQNRIVSGQSFSESEHVSAQGKSVLVIGGGDTGSDCVGTAIRQKAASVTQIEIMSEPPKNANPETPWPYYPHVLKTSSSHQEGCVRSWSLLTKRFLQKEKQLTGVEVQNVGWIRNKDGQLGMREIGEPEIIPADMVLLSMGFLHPEHEGLLNKLAVKYDKKGNVAAERKNQSSVDKVFIAGDVTLGASLVVRAIISGREAAQTIDDYLTKK